MHAKGCTTRIGGVQDQDTLKEVTLLSLIEYSVETNFGSSYGKCPPIHTDDTMKCIGLSTRSDLFTSNVCNHYAAW